MDLLITPSFCTSDVTTVAYRDDLGIDLMLSSVYMSYEATSSLDNLIGLQVEYANRKRCRFVLSCNANAHHTQWGSADINTRCASIFNFIILNRLNICNTNNMDKSMIRD